MTHTTAQRAYHTRRNDLGNALTAQAEAERTAMINGDAAEALACRNRARAIRERMRRIEGISLERGQAEANGKAPDRFQGITSSLGGMRDPISQMLIGGKIDMGQARAALVVRDYFENETISIAGGTDLSFYDGKSCGGMEATVHARLIVGKAWRAAMAKSHPADGAHVVALIRGQYSMREAAKRSGGKTVQTVARLSRAVGLVLTDMGKVIP